MSNVFTISEILLILYSNDSNIKRTLVAFRGIQGLLVAQDGQVYRAYPVAHLVQEVQADSILKRNRLSWHEFAVSLCSLVSQVIFKMGLITTSTLSFYLKVNEMNLFRKRERAEEREKTSSYLSTKEFLMCATISLESLVDMIVDKSIT